jgi:ABC-type multidrug transport system fused ATPase/permease subunit
MGSHRLPATPPPTHPPAQILSWWSLEKYLSYNYPANLMDMLIVLVSDTFFVLEFFYSGLFNASILRLVRLFRMVRAVRAFKTVSSMQRLRLILEKAAHAMKTCIYVFLILILWHVAMALLGMQIFACPVRDSVTCKRANETAACPDFCSDLLGSPPQCVFNEVEIFDHCPWDAKRNFNTFLNSFAALFFVTTGDSSWTETMHRGMRSLASPVPGLLFFLIFYLVSVYGICNLFISVILSAFEMDESQKVRIQLNEYRNTMVQKVLKDLRLLRFSGSNKKEKKKAAAQQAEQRLDDADYLESIHIEDDSDQEEELVVEDDYEVLFCLPPPLPNAEQPDRDRNFRYFIRRIVRSRVYNAVVLSTILFSAVLLALDSRIRSKAKITLRFALICDYVFFGIFGLEFLLKVMDTGLAFEGPEAYFRKVWNWIDFVLLCAQALDFIGVDGMKALRVLRVLRPLRSLRLLNKIEQLQKMILALASSLGDIFNVLFLWLMAFVLFGVVGMTLFQGKGHMCSDPLFVGFPLNPGEEKGSVVGWRENCAGAHVVFESQIAGLLPSEKYYTSITSPTGILRPRVWSHPPHAPSEVSFSFDNFALTCQTLYEVSTLRGWSRYVYVGMDSVDVGRHPQTNYQQMTFFYFVAWVMVSAFFIVQMIIGVLIDAINQQTGTAMFTNTQRSWKRMLLKMRRATKLVPIPMPKNVFIKKTWLLSNHPYFSTFYTIVIGSNIVLMATEHYNQPPLYERVALSLNIVLLALYVIEIIIKIVATVPNIGLYFRDGSNIFDLVIVIASIVDIGLSAGGGKSGLQVCAPSHPSDFLPPHSNLHAQPPSPSPHKSFKILEVPIVQAKPRVLDGAHPHPDHALVIAGAACAARNPSVPHPPLRAPLAAFDGDGQHHAGLDSGCRRRPRLPDDAHLHLCHPRKPVFLGHQVRHWLEPPQQLRLALGRDDHAVCHAHWRRLGHDHAGRRGGGAHVYLAGGSGSAAG